ncbi:hypothetical protein HPOKI102_05805 [Helicobacter pylori oki102]|nr:hypothetical protein HPOKI102_05805 [Helicobacter pylori oki102]
MKHPFLKLFYPKKTELERILFLVFMLFLMKINLKKGFKHFILSLF